MRYTLVIDDEEHRHLMQYAERKGISVPELLSKILNGRLTLSPLRLAEGNVLIEREHHRSGAADHGQE